jgi:Flp pilus assembly protein TadG
MNIRRFLRRLHAEKGSALVEFALIVPSMLIILSGIFDYAIFFQAKIQVQDQAEAGAAFGAIPGNQNNLSGMQFWATYNQQSGGGLSAASSYQATATNIFTCTPGGASVSYNTLCAGNPAGTPIEYVQVKTQAVYKSILICPGIPSKLTLIGQAVYRVTWCAPAAASCS